MNLEGFADLLNDLAAIDPDLRRELKQNVGDIIEPVRRDAEANASRGIRKIGKPWSRMRSGVTRGFAVAYVAPVKRGVRVGSPLRRPNLAELLLPEMEKALDGNEGSVERNVELLVDKVTRGW